MLFRRLVFFLAAGFWVLATAGAQAMPPEDPAWMLFDGIAKNAPRQVEQALQAGAPVNLPDPLGNTPLCVAVAMGRSALLPLLLQGGADSLSPCLNGALPLHLAAAQGNPALTQTLLDAPHNLRWRDGYGATALHLAAAGGSEAVVQLLLAKGADPTQKDQWGRTPHEVARQMKHTPLLDLLTRTPGKKTSPVKPPKHRRTPGIPSQTTPAPPVPPARTPQHFPVPVTTSPLHNAVLNQDAAALAALLSGSKETLDHGNNTVGGQTALHLAVAAARLDMVRLMLRAGANPRLGDNRGLTPLHLAPSVLITQALLEAGADPNTTTQAQDTPLHLAALNNRLGVIKTLVAAGADTGLLNQSGRTALDLAEEMAGAEVTTFLTSKTAAAHSASVDLAPPRAWTPGAEASPASPKQATAPPTEAPALLSPPAPTTSPKEPDPAPPPDKTRPEKPAEKTLPKMPDPANITQAQQLLEAVLAGDRQSVQELLEAGVSVSVRDDQGLTGVHLAASKGNLDMLKLLLEKGASVNTRDQYGITPLHLAAVKGHLQAAELLRRHGAETDFFIEVSLGNLALVKEKAATLSLKELQGPKGTNPLHWVRDAAVTEFLLSQNVSPTQLAVEDVTPLHLVSGQGLMEVAVLLKQHGADLNAVDASGNTPLDWALLGSHHALANWLVNQSAKTGAQVRKKP